MKKITFALMAFLCTLSLKASVIVGPITNPNNNHTYYLLTANSWTASEAEAEKMGGTLAIIDNASEQEWVFSKFGEYGNESRNLWIGLQETAKEGVYVWVDGSALNYTNWLPGEPNNVLSTEGYVHMIRTDNPWQHKGGTWNDLPNAGQPGSPFNIVFGVVEIAPLQSEVFPNPCNQILNLRLSIDNQQQATVSIKIVNMLGQELLSIQDIEPLQGWLQKVINVSVLPTGTYFVLVCINDKQQAYKVIKLN
ncbi:MAG: T9SS type A sorting domain-containing protein [Candidatus Kapabacteria bacterium]|nr:T9SS type A sorting domain-containing protein [Candidatus Kapabacteria bacterium]